MISEFVGIQPNGRRILYGTAPPSSAGEVLGGSQAGDIVLQDGVSAALGSQHGWRCVESGDPGVWSPFSMVQYAEVSLTAAQVKALRATPAELVPAPGAGFMLQFLWAQLFLDYGGTNAFTESTDNLQVKLEDGSGVAVSEAIETTNFIDQTADTATTARGKIDVIAAKAACENMPLVLHNTGDGEIAGNAANNNVVRVKVAYMVHRTGW